jgi:hypothetical protein
LARRFPNPARAARNAAQRLYDIRMGMDALSAEAAELRREVAALRSDVSELRAEGTDGRATALETARVNQAEALRVMRLLHDDEPANRQRVWRLRETPEYALAFEEAEPLVSFNLATYTNLDGLMERALPSVLGQTYERIEVIVVGDAAAPEIERAVKGLKDPRVRFYNQTYRGPYDEAGERLWYVDAGVAHWHLAAYSPLGYRLDASYALLATALEFFAGDGVRWASLGAGAGLSAEPTDGLSRFKAGWATDTRTVHLCGRILDPERYEALGGPPGTPYFPAYRADSMASR